MRKLGMSRIDTLAAGALLVGTLLACKKDKEEPPPIASTPAPVETKKEPEKKTVEPAKEKVKRYGSKETEESGTVKIAIHHAKVYEEADDSGDHASTLSKGTLVNRKARMGNWMLIEYPSGPGELSPGWIPLKHLTTVKLKIDPKKVVEQDAGTKPPPKKDAATTKQDAAATTKDAAPPKKDAAPPKKDAAPPKKTGGRLHRPKIK